MFEADNVVNEIYVTGNKRYCDIVGIEDKVFPTTFLILKVAGFWSPTTIKLRSLYICYQFYTVFCFISVVMLIVSILLDNALSDDKSFMSLMEYWYMLVIFSNGVMKIINLLMRRTKVINILQKNMMEDRWARSWHDHEESIILKKSKQSEKAVTLFWFTMIVINGLSNALNPIIRENPNRILMFECYSPCDRSLPICFWISYGYQCFGYAIVSITHVGCDCLIFNFIDRTCAHLKILEQRLTKLPIQLCKKMRGAKNVYELERFSVRQCIEDHRSIYRTVDELNRTFYETVFIQFLLSISVLCTNIYFLSKQDLFSPDFIGVFAYLCCALVQNFFYCWYGYKLTENSCDVVSTIFYMDWLTLRDESRKMLQFVMLSASKGITLFNNAVVNLTPEMFLKMVKVSYSAFNLLQQTYRK